MIGSGVDRDVPIAIGRGEYRAGTARSTFPKVRNSSTSGMKPAFSLFLVLTVLLCALCTTARAGLDWDSPTVTIDTQGSPETRLAEFRFHNDSDQPVRIRSVKTSCGCTVVKPEQEVYAPGAKGVLRVSHKPKPGSVPRRYRISISTDESGRRVHDLALVVLSEPRLVVEGRRMLVWEKGELRAPKEIVLRTKSGDALRLTGVAAESDFVTAELNGTGETRTLRITPKDGATGRVRIRLQSEPRLTEMDATFFAVLR